MKRLAMPTLVVLAVAGSAFVAGGSSSLAGPVMTPEGAGKAYGDTVYVLGGPGSLTGKFEDLGGLPDDQGWIGVDLTLPPGQHWHVDTFNTANLDPGQPDNHAWWCGEVMVTCGGGDPPEGYGNGWRDWLDWYGTIADTSLAVTVRVTAQLNHDTETGYDFLFLESETAGGMQAVASFDGKGTGVAIDETFALATADYVGAGGDQVHLRLRFESDGGQSDEDCGHATGGAAQIDLVSVFFDQGGGEVQIGDTETCETGNPLQWSVATPPGVGNFARVWPLLGDADPLHLNATPQFAFIDDGVVVPGTGGYPGQTWTYGPGGFIVNPEGGLEGPAYHLHNEIWSPVLPWPAAYYDGAVLAFDVYRHLPVGAGSPGIYYVWHVRSTADPAGVDGWTAWQDRGQVYDGAPEYFRQEEDVDDLLLFDRTYVQIALGAYEYGWTLGLNGTDGTPAPYFDNVALRAYDTACAIVQPDGSGDFSTIQEAIDAPCIADGDTIWLGDGTFRGDGNRDLDYGGKRIVIRSLSDNPEVCIIDCEGTAIENHRGFWFHTGEDTTAILEGVTVTGGYVADRGGAVYCETDETSGKVTPKFINCVFRDNTAAEGGAIAGLGVPPTPDLLTLDCRDCLFEDNHATSSGGAVCLSMIGGELKLRKSTFTGNTAVGGGACWYYDDTYGSVSDCWFTGNTADSAGGAVYGSVENYVGFDLCRFIGNQAVQGGAMCFATGAGKLRREQGRRGRSSFEQNQLAKGGGPTAYESIDECFFQRNIATQQGGAVYVGMLAAPVFDKCYFDGNSAIEGGAIYCCRDAYPTVTSSTLRNNSATYGGVLFVEDYTSPYPFLYPSLAGCTLVDNSADEGVELYGRNLPFFPIIEQNILAFGGPGEAIHLENTGAVTITCCDIYGHAGGDWIGPLAGSYGVDGNFASNPLFCDRADSLLILAANSPCLAGNNPFAEPCGQVGAFDQGCGSLSYWPERVFVTATSRSYVHPGDSISVTLSLLDGGDIIVPDEGWPPSFGLVGGLGSLASPALQSDSTWTASYQAGGVAGDDTVTGYDPETAATPRDSVGLQIIETAIVYKITDIVPDQGGQVRIWWQYDLHDTVSDPTPIIQYVVWRRIEPPARGGDRPVVPPAEVGEVLSALAGGDPEPPLLETEDAVWEPVGPAIPAMQWTEYAVVVPTLADSTFEGITWSVFFVSAHSSVPSLFFSSPIDSGYSVDNLAPHAPQGFAVAYGGTGNQLSWAEHTDEDFQYFRVYRDVTVGFLIDPGNLIHTTVETDWLDPGDGTPYGWHYKITAVDFSGRESAPTSPFSIVAVGDDSLPRRHALYGGAPNPFNPQTVIAYDVAAGGGRVIIKVFDLKGRHVLTLVDELRPAGRHSVTWRGRNTRGEKMPSGVYFCQLVAPGYRETVKVTLVQ